MKTAVVFDCSGTLVNVKRIIKEIKSQRFLCDHQTVDIVDKKKGRSLLILKEKINILNLNPKMPIKDLLENIQWKITYCKPPIIKENILKDKETKLKELQDTINILNKFNIKTEPGYALICDTIKGKMEYTIATGGCLFDGVHETIEKLKGMGVKIYLASGDSRYAIERLSRLVGINERYIIPEAHQNLKRDLVRRLKREGYRVIMVGDGSNDVPAMLESDLSIINLQGGSVSKKALDNADIKIENIKEILDVLDYRKCIL